MAKFIGFVLILVIVVGFVVPTIFLDKSFAMDRTTEINAGTQEIQEVVTDLTSWDDWTVWTKEVDPTLERTYTGEAGQVGHAMTWSGEDLGEGSLEITEITPDAVRYVMTYEDMPSKGEFLFNERDDGTTAVRWTSSGEMDGMPYERYFGLIVDRITGPPFEEGLANLKERLENANGSSTAPDTTGAENSNG